MNKLLHPIVDPLNKIAEGSTKLENKEIKVKFLLLTPQYKSTPKRWKRKTKIDLNDTFHLSEYKSLDSLPEHPREQSEPPDSYDVTNTQYYSKEETIPNLIWTPSHDTTLREHSSNHTFDDTQIDLVELLENVKKSYKEYDVEIDVRKWTNEYKIGNSSVTFQSDNIKIGDSVYTATPGLTELLFELRANESKITDEDIKYFEKIVLETHAHRKSYKKDNSIREDISLAIKKISTISISFRRWESSTIYDNIKK